jgi:hypothetical protein
MNARRWNCRCTFRAELNLCRRKRGQWWGGVGWGVGGVVVWCGVQALTFLSFSLFSLATPHRVVHNADYEDNVKWTIPVPNASVPLVHSCQRSSGLTKRYPYARLSDLKELYHALHFREYRVLRCKGIITNVRIIPPPDLSGFPNQWAVEYGDGVSSEALNTLRECTGTRVTVTLQSIDEDGGGGGSSSSSSAGGGGGGVVYPDLVDVAMMRPMESMPLNVPGSLYRHAEIQRGEQDGGVGLPTVLDAVASCFTCGRREEDVVSVVVVVVVGGEKWVLRLGTDFCSFVVVVVVAVVVWQLVKGMIRCQSVKQLEQCLKKGLKGKTFLCLIEMERAAKGTPERAVRLILAEEVVGSVAL